ncbi:MAG: ATP-dependent RNA helicase HrpA [Acidimicrobiales bacterium]
MCRASGGPGSVHTSRDQRGPVTTHPARGPAGDVRSRRAIPAMSYPADLPITARRDELVEAIAQHQVLVVAGETGSGKSTQLPKLCLDAGRGATGWIGHTQPRRIAARSIADRIADETGTTLGDVVGYAVRFDDTVGPDTAIKLMTDGILLAEIQRDRLLRRYDTIIVDEAHERSLNIDFLLGYLRRLLPERPDLRVIVTSATIDTERFSQHFHDAPVIEVSGRTYPVEVRYRPLDDVATGRSLDQSDGIVEAVRQLRREGPGDVLVFCSGEREIRDAAHALRSADLRDTEILPLYARLSAAEQHRVFRPHDGRRVVLATNVAETSLTVPGVRYVVDPGTARISRFSHRTKVQRLPIEPVSQASADQRAGRCGRVGPGICIRLYTEDDFHARPEFTEPEIQRTNLASVILQMASLGLGEVEDFPFVDPPDHRAIRDGIALLHELDAIDPDHPGTRRWLTPVGRTLAALPVDPRLGRMVVEADHNGCLHEVMVIAAALSIQDPRERPIGADRSEADALHARFRVPGSDLMSYVALWDHLHEMRQGRSSNQFRRQCKAEYLHVLRIREWQDLYAQLRRVAGSVGMRRSSAPDQPELVHRSLLAGLLTQVGARDRTERAYRGVRNTTFAIAPGSALGAKGPRWVMAAELVETNRLWARGVAGIRPEWIEQLADHLVTRSYGEAEWDRQRGSASTVERVTLHGLPLVEGRRVSVERVDPELAHRLFVTHALVEGEWEAHHDFVERNAARRRVIDERSAKVRRDLHAPPERLHEFFTTRVPDEVASTGRFNRWWAKRSRRDPRLLDLSLELLTDPAAGPYDPDAYPDVWEHRGHRLTLQYRFDPTSQFDGVSVQVPIALVAQLDPHAFEGSIPGYRLALVEALVRALPKSHRRALVPVPETAARALGALGDVDDPGRPFLDSLRRQLEHIAGTPLPAELLDLDAVPDHLRPTFLVHDDDGTVIAWGKDLARLRDQLAAEVRAALSSASTGWESAGHTDWPGDSIPRRVEVVVRGHELVAYPALVDDGDSVAVRLCPDRDEQAETMWAGTRRLLRLRLPATGRALARLIDHDMRLALVGGPWGSEQDWIDDIVDAVLDHLMESGGGPAFTAEGFEALVDHVRDGVGDTVRTAWSDLAGIVRRHRAVTRRLDRLIGPGFEAAATDVRAQLGRLVYRGMVSAMGIARVGDVQRYLAAIEHRLAAIRDDPRRDTERMVRCRRLEREYEDLAADAPPSPELDEVGWMLEEFRVATFAQALGTSQPVSDKRIRAALAAVPRR